ncbi:MAG: hypothetical protein ACREFO_04525 [Acetobacteraceae bacterium]
MTDWNPEQELVRVLDALTEEILATPDRDVAAWLDRKRAKGAAREMRRLVAAAESGPIARPAVEFAERSYISRNQ